MLLGLLEVFTQVKLLAPDKLTDAVVVPVFTRLTVYKGQIVEPEQRV